MSEPIKVSSKKSDCSKAEQSAVLHRVLLVEEQSEYPSGLLKTWLFVTRSTPFLFLPSVSFHLCNVALLTITFFLSSFDDPLLFSCLSTLFSFPPPLSLQVYLIADTRLYISLCPPLHPSIRSSMRLSISLSNRRSNQISLTFSGLNCGSV